jgi:hypothetical protein
VLPGFTGTGGAQAGTRPEQFGDLGLTQAVYSRIRNRHWRKLPTLVNPSSRRFNPNGARPIPQKKLPNTAEPSSHAAHLHHASCTVRGWAQCRMTCMHAPWRCARGPPPTPPRSRWRWLGRHAWRQHEPGWSRSEAAWRRSTSPAASPAHCQRERDWAWWASYACDATRRHDSSELWRHPASS